MLLMMNSLCVTGLNETTMEAEEQTLQAVPHLERYTVISALIAYWSSAITLNV